MNELGTINPRSCSNTTDASFVMVGLVVPSGFNLTTAPANTCERQSGFHGSCGYNFDGQHPVDCSNIGR
eukprot:3132874-Pyramimonas_sp.AAC.1